MNNNLNEKKTGFIPPKIDDTHFVLGGLTSLPKIIVNPSGDWSNYLPIFESQLQSTFDSDGCTVYGTLNCIEIFENFLKENNPNHSKRYVYNVVGITPPGSDPHLVATNIRGKGLVNQSDLPDIVSSLLEFETPRPMTPDLISKGQEWLKKYNFGHEWLWNEQPDQATRLSIMKECLKYSPLGISVTAWYQNTDGLYYSPQGIVNEHWVCVYNIDDTGIYVFDSYMRNLKKLTLDHNIQYAKRYSVTPITENTTPISMSWFQKIIQWILQNLKNL